MESLSLLIVVATCVLAVIAALKFRRGSSVWTILFGSIAVGVVVMVVLAFLDTRQHAYRTARQREIQLARQADLAARTAVRRWDELQPAVETADAAIAPKPTQAEIAATGGAAWLPQVEKEFPANQYPSARTAARVLVHRIVPLIPNALAADGKVVQKPKLSHIQLGGAVEAFRGSEHVLADMAELLRREFEGAKVTTDTQIAQLADDAVSIVVQTVNEVQSSPAPWISGPQVSGAPPAYGSVQVSGTLRASVSGSSGKKFDVWVNVIDKPWVENFDKYVSEFPQLQRLQARSPQFAGSEAEARQQALDAAAAALADHVVSGFRQSSRPGYIVLRQPTGHEVRNELLAQLQSGRYIVDRFAQRFSRPYGDVWREVLLVDYSQPQLRSSVIAIETRHAYHRQDAANLILQFLALVTFICVLYFFLNAATKGYYRWAIRTAMVVLAVCIGASLLLMA